jgi:alpha-beta hydrolase superfamily lysophospholipase
MAARRVVGPVVFALALGVVVAGGAEARRFDPSVEVTQVLVRTAPGEETPAVRLAPRGPSRGTALLAHGITASKETLLLVAESLARAGFTCLAIDLPGHGASRAAFARADLPGALAGAARALAPDGRVDVFVGHSLGAGVGATAVEQGLLPRPRLFVALGAAVANAPGERTLLLTGRLDVLATPDRVRAAAAGRASVDVLVAGCDHVLEPFDPTLVRATVAAARAAVGAPPPTPPVLGPVATWRALGALLVVLAGPLVALGAPRRAADQPPPSGAAALVEGALWGALRIVLLVVALDGAWVGLAPRPRHVLALVLVLPLCLLPPLALGRLASDLRPALRPHEALVGGGLTTLGALLATALLAGLGAWFLAMLGGIFVVIAAAATLIATWTARRVGHPLAGHAAFAVLVGYWPALCAPLFVP